MEPYFRFLGVSSWVLLFAASAALAAPAAPSSVEDVSLDPLSGDTFIVPVTGPNEGRILWLNDFQASFEKALAIPAQSSRTEIELNRPGRLATLLQLGDQWILTGFEKTASGTWAALPAQAALTGRGQASRLTTLPDGNLALTVESPSAEPAVLLIAETSQASGRYQVVESIPESDITQRAEKIVSALENPATPGAEPAVESSNGLGFTAGALSGVGIAYRRHFANKWGIQVGGIAFGNPSHLMASLGVNVMRTLSKSQRVRFYAVFGASTFYQGNDSYTTSLDCGISPDPKACEPVSQGWVNNSTLNFGAGIGMEIELAKNLGLALELPVTLMLDSARGNVDFSGVYPIPSGSLIYYF